MCTCRGGRSSTSSSRPISTTGTIRRTTWRSTATTPRTTPSSTTCSARRSRARPASRKNTACRATTCRTVSSGSWRSRSASRNRICYTASFFQQEGPPCHAPFRPSPIPVMRTEAVPMELRAVALQCLTEPDPETKVAAVAAMAAAAGAVAGASAAPQSSAPIPGRPQRPELVPPRQVGHRSMATVEGRAMLIHALAHIEFNAMNLALDALWRFPDLPAEYYVDWLRVAKEEAGHFALLAAHMRRLGHEYGDFAAHDSLWEMVEKTSGDVLARMALVPRTLEARGLDAIPPLRAKLAQAGDL